MQNFLKNGSNSVVWDGKESAGNNLPALPTGQEYNAIITTRAGEYHFPMIDAERNPNGLKITMENPPGAFPSGITATTVYYNDENYTTASGIPIVLDGVPTTKIASSPRDATAGVDSSGGAHSYSGSPSGTAYGDNKGIDTWTYFSSAAILTPVEIIGPNQTGTNVQGTKSVKFLTDADSSGSVTLGDTVQYSVTYSNLTSTQDATNFIINDTLPSQLTFVPGSATITQTAGNTIALNSSYTGTVAGSVVLTNSSGTLRNNDTITITINATINNTNGGSPISNQASASFGTSITTLPPSYTVLTDATPTTGVTNPPEESDFLQTADDSIDTGNNTTSTADDDPTLFTVVSAKLLLVKRITRINGTDYMTFNNGDSTLAPTEANYVAAPKDVDDNDPKWPSSYIKGLINAGNVKPGDILEYTIYFLSNGQSAANKVKFCDLVPSNVTFLPTAFNTSITSINIDGGFPTSNYGIALAVGSTTPTVYLSNVVEDQDRGSFYPANDPTTPTFCGSNTNGAVVVNITNTTTLTSLPAATVAGNPPESYGFVRFRAVVK